ncbi:hypothetical protein LEMLEM_LOCUS21730, partial [Lemmus lemmus]
MREFYVRFVSLYLMYYSMRSQQNLAVKETSSHCQASFKTIIFCKYILLKTSVSGLFMTMRLICSW